MGKWWEMQPVELRQWNRPPQNAVGRGFESHRGHKNLFVIRVKCENFLKTNIKQLKYHFPASSCTLMKDFHERLS